MDKKKTKTNSMNNIIHQKVTDVSLMPMDLNGIKRKAFIRDALLQPLVDDAISLVCEYAHQDVILILSGEYIDDPDDDREDGDQLFKPSCILWVFDPSVVESKDDGGWKKYILNESIHCGPDVYNRGLFHHNKTQFTTVGLNSDNNTFVIKTMDCLTGHVITQNNISDESLAAKSQEDDLRGKVHFTTWPNVRGQTTVLSYDIVQSRRAKPIECTSQFAQVFNSPTHHQLYGYNDVNDHFLQYEDTIWKRRANPCPEFDMPSSRGHLIHNNMFYLFDREDGRWQQYDLTHHRWNVMWQRYDTNTDRWNMMPSRQKKLCPSYDSSAAVIDDTMYVFCVSPCSCHCVYTYNLNQSVETGVWKEMPISPRLYENNPNLYMHTYSTTVSI